MDWTDREGKKMIRGGRMHQRRSVHLHSLVGKAIRIFDEGDKLLFEGELEYKSNEITKGRSNENPGFYVNDIHIPIRRLRPISPYYDEIRLNCDYLYLVEAR